MQDVVLYCGFSFSIAQFVGSLGLDDIGVGI